MGKLISADEALRRLQSAYNGSVFIHGNEDNLFADGLEYAIDIISDMPADGVGNTVYAEWVMRTDSSGNVKAVCTNCQKPNKQYTPPYCPHCGARMEKPK